jgi:hypothetical protein
MLTTDSQELFTAKDAEDANENRELLPRINADERGLETEEVSKAVMRM